MKRKALFIGVNDYRDPEIRNLSCSVRDAISMHDIFEELGYQTNLLENPGKGDVFHAIRKITSDMAAGDQFLFYFAGHGFTDSGQHLLFCADDIHEHLRFHRAGIPFDLLEMETRKGGYGRAFLLDACQSDFLTGTRGEDTTTRDLVAIGDMVPKSEDATGAFYVLRSCSKYEHALEIESRKHGLFTLAMIDILRQSKNSGMELLFSDSLRETVRAKMYCIAQAEGITARQTPESDGRGAVQVLISGMKRGAASVMVDCPVCGRHNRVEETFKCKICGRDHLCASHFSDEGNCCKECAEKLEVQTNTKSAIEAYNRNDYAKAFSLAQKSDKSIAVIQYIIGYGFENGFGCDKNQVEAIKWYRKAQERGYSAALVRLENIWKDTAVRLAGERKNLDKEKFWEDICNGGDIESCHHVLSDKTFSDELYDKIMRIDWQVALDLIEDANTFVSAELTEYERLVQSLVHSQKNLKSIKEDGINDPYLQFQVGMILYACPSELDKANAFKWFEKSTKQKCPPSLYMMGRMYEYGECVEQSYRKAKMLFDRADMSFPMQQVAMAHIYEFGLSDVTKDKDVGAATEWYQYAIEEFGSDLVMPLYLRARRTLNSLYPDELPKLRMPTVGDAAKMPFSRTLSSHQPYVTEDTKKSIESAVEAYKVETAECYRKAARNGDVKAQYELGRSLAVLFDDRLRKKEEIEGVDWLRKAAERGLVAAQSYIGNYLLWYFDTHDAPVSFQAEGVSWLNKAAGQGDVEAQCLLGYIYSSGDGAEVDHEAAIRWYRAAAEQGSAKAQYKLGCCYEQGCGVTADLTKAIDWYFRAASQGNKDAQYKVGWCRYYGKGYPLDYPEAVAWFRKAAEQGHACAQFYLGWCYYKGDGIVQNLEEAIKWYRKAAEQGDIDACYNLGCCYHNGEGVDRDCVAAVKWYRKAADFGYALAQGNLGWMYANGEGVKQNDREALAWFRKAAEQGNDNAQYSVGWMYENGRGVDRNDVEAVRWYVKASEQGHTEALSNITSLAQQGCVEAQYNLALLYLNGKGVDKNNAEALKWFLKAAEQKNVDAQLWAGVIYGNGNGVPQNYEEAVKWYRAAADQGNAMSQFNLGVMYANGLGVKGDLSVAAEWYRRAAAQGHEKAKEALKKIESVLKNDAIFKGVMRDFLKKTNGGVKKAASGEGAKPSDLKTGTVKTLVLPGGAKMEMIYVAPGSFMMGSPEGEAGRYRNETLHHVTITKGYWLGKYPVTQEQWVSVMKNNPSRFKGDSRPVENISWNDCKMFIGKVRLESEYVVRLPTEAEWEYACRAGSTGGYGVRGSIDQISWHCDNSNETTHPVGQKGENAWGFNDMHGNVWEWCEDWYGAYINKAQVDPIGADSGESRVARGGSWFDPVYCGRSAMRSSYSPSVRDPAMGFRLCCSM